MSIRIVIVGPGRVGSAMARRLAAAGGNVLGFVGRSTEHTEAAIAFCGTGRSLSWRDLAAAHVVLFAVGDPELRPAVEAAAAHAAPRACSLWLHTSGRHGLEVFAAAGSGIRRGALHPVVPIADAASGACAMAGALALIEGDARSERLLRRLCRLLGMVPMFGGGVDRVLYHAACAMASNGLTALRAAVDRVFAAAGGLTVPQQRLLADALMAAALRASSQVGPANALSGPVRRGDVATVVAHLAALQAGVPQASALYRAVMAQALELTPGLPPASEQQLRAYLQPRPQER